MDNLVKVFTGPEGPALLLKKRLEGAGIEALIKNDSPDAFLGVAPASVDLYVQAGDLTKAVPIMQELKI